MSLFWPRARRAIEAFAKRHVKSIHEKLDSHHEELLAQAQDHHREVIDQAEHHHREHLAALGAKPGPKRDAKGHFTK
jgi:Mg2+ and Co2+ transporter CorA